MPCRFSSSVMARTLVMAERFIPNDPLSVRTTSNWAAASPQISFRNLPFRRTLESRLMSWFLAPSRAAATSAENDQSQGDRCPTGPMSNGRGSKGQGQAASVKRASTLRRPASAVRSLLAKQCKSH